MRLNKQDPLRREIKGFTGLVDRYEVPVDPEIRFATTDCLPEDNAPKVMTGLIAKRFLQEA